MAARIPKVIFSAREPPVDQTARLSIRVIADQDRL